MTFIRDILIFELKYYIIAGDLKVNDKLQAAIDVLLEELEEQEKSVIDTKRMINSLRRRIGKNPFFNDTELQKSQNINRADMFYGKPLATAVREYLELRKSACNTEEIFDGLKQGGFDFVSLQWNEKSRIRNLSISIAKNTSYFHRLPNGTFGLLSWYPDIRKKKPEQVKIHNNTENKEPEEISKERNENKNMEEKENKIIVEN